MHSIFCSKRLPTMSEVVRSKILHTILFYLIYDIYFCRDFQIIWNRIIYSIVLFLFILHILVTFISSCNTVLQFTYFGLHIQWAVRTIGIYFPWSGWANVEIKEITRLVRNEIEWSRFWKSIFLIDVEPFHLKNGRESSHSLLLPTWWLYSWTKQWEKPFCSIFTFEQNKKNWMTPFLLSNTKHSIPF